MEGSVKLLAQGVSRPSPLLASLAAASSRSPGFYWGSVQVFLSGYRSQQEQTLWATFSDGKSSIIVR